MKKLACCILLLAACGDATDDNGSGGQAPPPPGMGSQAQLDATDQAEFQMVSRAFAASRAKFNEIWPRPQGAYELHKMPIYLVRRDTSRNEVKGYLLNASQAPSGATAVAHDSFDGLGQVYRYDAEISVVSGQNFLFGTSFDPKVNGVGMYVWPYSASDPMSEEGLTNPSNENHVGTFVHEGFHRYQDVEGAWMRNPEFIQDEENYPLNESNIALAILEHKILLAGLAGDAATALRQFVAVRATRIADPANVVNGTNYVSGVDNGQEWGEGTAEFAERRFMAAMGLSYGSPTLPTLETKLGLYSQFPTKASIRSEFGFGRFYATGAAVLQLLASTQVAFVDGTKAGQSPYAIAAAAHADAASSERASLVDAAKAAHSYDSTIVPEARQLLALP